MFMGGGDYKRLTMHKEVVLPPVPVQEGSKQIQFRTGTPPETEIPYRVRNKAAAAIAAEKGIQKASVARRAKPFVPDPPVPIERRGLVLIPQRGPRHHSPT